MRLLFLSNYYPPFARGGYEQWCQEVADALAARGHELHVITSRASQSSALSAPRGVQVSRVLHLEVEAGLTHTLSKLLLTRHRAEQENLAWVRKTITEFRPEAALVWGMWNVPRAVPTMVEQLLPERVAYYLCDYWLSLPSAYISQWQNPSVRALTGLPKRLLGAPLLHQLRKEPQTRLRLERPLCVSRAVRDLLVRDGVPIAHAEVIYGGIRPEEFAASRPEPHAGLRLLYAGRLTADKGVHTAIRALSLIAPQLQQPISLDIVGAGEASYAQHLRQLVVSNGLGERVLFRGSVSRAQMPNVFALYDALLFPSEWDEPFARTVLEAMAAGLVVVGTTTGGTGEVLVEGKTGLTFPRGDAAALAQQIARLRDQPALGDTLRAAAHREVEARFTFPRMVQQIESALRQA